MSKSGWFSYPKGIESLISRARVGVEHGPLVKTPSTPCQDNLASTCPACRSISCSAATKTGVRVDFPGGAQGVRRLLAVIAVA
jgi:hypothetical protein